MKEDTALFGLYDRDARALLAMCRPKKWWCSPAIPDPTAAIGGLPRLRGTHKKGLRICWNYSTIKQGGTMNEQLQKNLTESNDITGAFGAKQAMNRMSPSRASANS
jgi:hypothetical protein